ncbi:MAG: putative DNA binding domain-containing protein [Candidatus Cloacimonadota bacterium]|nr:putative DNA binding domain-containing protein [Candidatus Cloacimonadota bacterium]
MKYTKKEIIEIISQKENSAVEFKNDAVRPESLAKEIVSFANTTGGTILIGVDDNGEISGTSKKEEWVMNIARNNLNPAISCEAFDYLIEEKRILLLDIPKGKNKPYQTIDGKFYIRVGSTNRQATQSELMRLFQQSGFLHFDLNPIERASFKSLNQSKLDRYFQQYSVEFAEEDNADQLRILRNTDILNENHIPTVAGILLFGINPQRFLPFARVTFAHFVGNEITEELIDKQNIEGNLDEQIDKSLSVIKNNILNSSKIEGAKRKALNKTYPEKVFRELLVNAVVHRNYSINGSAIRIFMFDDRIEFISPGKLPNTVTIEKIKDGVSYAVNPVIVKFMENLRYIDKLGRGIPMICKEAEKLNKNVTFKEIGEEFKIILEL